MKVLITGINGFVGPYLAKELHEHGYKIVGTTHASTDGTVPEYVETRKLDITDRDLVQKVVQEVRPDILVHLAAVSSVRFSIDHPHETHKINVEGTKNVVDAVRSLPKVRMLFISSSEVYGIPSQIPIPEDADLSPVSPYAETKVQGEHICMESADDAHEMLVSRSFNHIGSGQQESFVSSSFAKQIAKLEKYGGTIKVGDLTAKRDFTDVRDVMRAYRMIIEKGKSGEAYNVCSGTSISIQELLDRLRSLSTKHIAEEVDESRLRPAEIPDLCGDNSKLKRDTGWEPQIPLEQSLKEILDYWRERV